MPRRPMNKLGEDSSTYNVRVNRQPKNQQNISKYVNIMKIIGNKSETHRFDMALYMKPIIPYVFPITFLSINLISYGRLSIR
jgi:hypothetical protein